MRGIIRLRVVKFAAAALAGLVFVCVAGFWVLHQYPSIGAYGSDSLRYIFGDQMVAAMETVLYQVQDRANQVEYRLGMLHPADPFSKAEASPLVKSGPTAPGASPSQPVPTRAAGSSANKVLKILPPTPAPKDTQPQATIQPDVWTPPQMQPLGTQPDEGIWQPYIRSASGQIVAYRSFVQPDPTRPYASVGVVAFDLQAVRLHYVIGFEEPYASKQLAKQPGSIPAADMNGLIAAFNGGFKFRHGHFGSMAEGFTSVPMRDGLSAVAVYQDGTVKIGAWGKDVTAAPDLIAVRQNGPLLIQDGNISAQVDNPSLWGYTLSGSTVTWRSGLAISQDGRTLYYFAGPSLSARTLAAAMSAAHPQSAMQLDINNFWVHFTAVEHVNQQLQSVPLFPKEMADGKDRYLHPYARDFFYVTANPAP